MALTMHPSLAVHAGAWLKTEIVEPHGITVKALAQHLGVSRQGLSNLLNGHGGLSVDMALRFEKAFGVKADTLLRMQLAHDLGDLRERENEIKVERVAQAARSLSPAIDRSGRHFQDGTGQVPTTTPQPNLRSDEPGGFQ